MRILGVFFNNGLVSVDNDNWKTKLDKLKSVLNLWSSRELSFIGRSMILNVLGASCFWHVAKVLIPPNWVFPVQRVKLIVFEIPMQLEPLLASREIQMSKMTPIMSLHVARMAISTRSRTWSKSISIRSMLRRIAP